MKKILTTIFASFLIVNLSAQLDCDKKYTMRVIAESGLNMRSKPSLSSSVVVTVPYDSTLVSCKSTSGDFQYEDIKGYWRKSIYKGKVGYMFDGFLEIVALKAPPTPTKTDTASAEKPDGTQTDTTNLEEIAEQPKIEKPKETPREYQFLTEAYNFCGNVEKINPGLLWYGFYPASTDDGEVDYRIEPVELSVVLSRTKIGEGMEFDIETDREERSIFLLGTSRKLDHENISIKDKSEMLRYAGRKLFPGQELDLKRADPALKLSATGSVNSSGPCPDLKNYKLMLNAEQLSINQNLTEEIPAGKCGLPEIFWWGDFTGDGLPEIIFVSVYDEENTFTLFISDARGRDELLHKQAAFTLKNCYE